MDIHEYQAKEMLSKFGVPIAARRPRLQPRAGGLPRHARSAATSGSSRRRSIPARRGKAGGIKVCSQRHRDRARGRGAARQEAGDAPDRSRRQARLAPLHRGGDRHRPRRSISASSWTAPPSASWSSPRRRAAWRSRRSRHKQPDTIIRVVGRPGRRHAGRSRRARSPSGSASSPSSSAKLVRDHPRLLPRLPRSRRDHGRDQPAGHHQGQARSSRSTPR